MLVVAFLFIAGEIPFLVRSELGTTCLLTFTQLRIVNRVYFLPLLVYLETKNVGQRFLPKIFNSDSVFCSCL